MIYLLKQERKTNNSLNKPPGFPGGFSEKKEREKQKMGRKKFTKAVPEDLQQLNGLNTFEDCVMALSFLAHRDTGRRFAVKQNYTLPIMCIVKNNTIEKLNACFDKTNDVILIGNGCWGNSVVTPLFYADGDGNVWTAKLSIKTDGVHTLHDFIYSSFAAFKNPVDSIEVKSFDISEWTPATEIPVETCALINSHDMLAEIFERKNKYAHAFFRDKGMGSDNMDKTLMIGLAHPELEQLSKAGYNFADYLLTYKRVTPSEWAAYGRLCRPATALKDIFKTSSSVYKALKNENDLSVWDMYRKMEKTGKIKNADEIAKLNRVDFGKKELTVINSVLNAKHNGKSIFTLQSLINYLDRLDTYEAIDAREALPLLQDYIGCCRTAGIEPRVDGDSLKREHDIAARMCRELRQKEYESSYEEAFKNACHKLAEFDYAEGTFSIRAIRDIDDLYDEAKQQHNCLAGYVHRIANHDANIFVMRDNNQPDKSLITVSVDKIGGRYVITQKLRAYNQPIRNKAQTEFLNRWINYVNRCANA